jgi:uncharacterized protein (TIGR01777 family)
VKVGITGSSGLIGSRLAAALGGDATALPREPQAPDVEGLDAVVHLAGEPVAQRWTDKAKKEIERSRVEGTRAVVAAMSPSQVLVSASAVGYYGPRGDERVPESEPPGSDFLASVCVGWEREAAAFAGRSVCVRTGVVLDASGGALKKMLPPFRLGIGGPVAGGAQWMPWIHIDDLVGIYLRALDDASWTGAYNAAAPEPVTNKEFSRELGRALHRPAFAPVPSFAVKVLFGEMAQIVTTGQRAVPDRTLAGGYAFSQPDLAGALRDVLA